MARRKIIRGTKGDANIWWVIIGAVIALVVLIVLMLIFTGRTQGLQRGIAECQGKGGVCTIRSDCPSNSLYSSAFDCPEGQRCCIGAPKQCVQGACGENEDCIDGYCYARTG